MWTDLTICHCASKTKSDDRGANRKRGCIRHHHSFFFVVVGTPVFTLDLLCTVTQSSQVASV